MKMRWFLLLSGFSIALVFSAVSTRSQTVVTFDDIVLSLPPYVTNIPNGYQGLNWSNFYVQSPDQQGWSNGYYYGLVSPPNEAYNGGGNPAEIDAAGTNFNFLSVYLTGAWASNLNINAEGFRSGTLIYDTNVIAAATNPTLFTFNYLDIDRLYFFASGGDPAFGGAGSIFVMDNMTFEFVPERSTFLLTALGVAMLWVVVKRRRT
jgi:hypothetical protein